MILSDTAMTKLRNLFRHKRAPIRLNHDDGHVFKSPMRNEVDRAWCI